MDLHYEDLLNAVIQQFHFQESVFACDNDS